MADNVAVTAGSGTTIAADEVVDATLGTVKVGYVKIMDGTLDGTTKAAVSASGLKVDLGADNDVTVTGSVTANAGTNLNTSALALEAGGNLAAIAASASVLDDWDETDRAKVNIIAAQAGVDGGSGTVSGATQRVVLATDVALPAGTNNIGDVDVLSVVPGTGATNLGKAIDTATGGTDTGVLALATRDDALGALTPIEGDNVQLRTDANGALWTHDDALDAALSGSELQVDVVGALPAGTNAIGKLAANSGVDIGDVDVTSLPSDVALTDDNAFTPGTTKVVGVGFHADESAVDSVNEGDIGAARMSLDRKQYAIAHNETSSIYNNGTAITPSFAVIDAATSGDNTLVAADATKKIRVTALFLVAAGTVNVRFEGGAGGTALTGQMNLVANTGFVLPFNPCGWFETAANTLLNLELSGAISVDGSLQYILV